VSIWGPSAKRGEGRGQKGQCVDRYRQKRYDVQVSVPGALIALSFTIANQGKSLNDPLIDFFNLYL